MTASPAGGNTFLTAKGLDISLAALQRQDPYINNIVDVASQVALYTFNNRANEWEKTDVEGTLFVYTRLASPRHGFTIQNRLSMDNLTEPITKDLDFQLQDPFLLYRNVRLVIHGIWFYDKEDCQRIATLMKNLTQQEQILAQHGQKQVQEQGQGGWASPRALEARDSKAVDILQMLTKARSEYDKGGKPSSEPKEIGGSRVLYDNPHLIKPIPVKPTDPQAGLRQTQDSKGEPRHLSLAALFGSQAPAEPLSPRTGLVPGSGVIRPAVACSLSYEDQAQAGGSGSPQHCPAIQKLMWSQEPLQPLSESPENRLSENGGAPPSSLHHHHHHHLHPQQPQPPQPQQHPQPQPRPELIQRLLQSHCSVSSSLSPNTAAFSASCAPPCCSRPPPLQQTPPPAPSLQPAFPRPHHAQHLFFSSSPAPPQTPGQPAAVLPTEELLQRLRLVQQEQSRTPQVREPPRPALAPHFHEPALPAPRPGHAQTSAAQKTSLQLQSVPVAAPLRPLLLSPSVFSQAKAPAHGSAPPNCCPPPSLLCPPRAEEEPGVLSKSQLQATLLDLIQTDSSFLDTIYEAYVCRLGNSLAANK